MKLDIKSPISLNSNVRRNTDEENYAQKMLKRFTIQNMEVACNMKLTCKVMFL